VCVAGVASPARVGGVVGVGRARDAQCCTARRSGLEQDLRIACVSLTDASQKVCSLRRSPGDHGGRNRCSFSPASLGIAEGQCRWSLGQYGYEQEAEGHPERVSFACAQ